MIRIVTDTASDITREQALAMDVELVTLGIHFKNGEFYDQLTDPYFDDFYERLSSSRELPITSQPAPEDYLTFFEKARDLGDEVIVITLSSGSSGTWQVARLARELADYPGVYIIDSTLAAIGQRLLVEYAVRLREEGRSAGEIRDTLTGAAGRVRLFAALDTLKYLRKGGRISMGAEVLGGMMGVKPLIKMEDGVTLLAGKARGHAGAITSLVRLIGEHADFDPAMPVYFGYTRDAQPAKNFRRLVSAKFQLHSTVLYPVGGAIGTHVGPGGLAIAYLEKH